ncbi:vitamin D3 receptor B-like isoform X3 [Apostichopus japonicus]|uniref:vitamin D3 receptor B-like isoform X3 n=1 Tax=Stichopus japonicus TaxID=307972 RepID=UPI003AB3521D
MEVFWKKVVENEDLFTGFEKMSVDYSKQKCLVCGDKASGLHYTVVSCESCKSFFGRKIKSKAKFSCEANGNCVMDLYTRRHCPACRLKKCLDVGMKPERVWDEKRLETRKPLERKNKKKQSNNIQQASPPTMPVSTSTVPPTISDTIPKLSPSQAELIGALEKAKKEATVTNIQHKPNGKFEELMGKVRALQAQLFSDGGADSIFAQQLPNMFMCVMNGMSGERAPAFPVDLSFNHHPNNSLPKSQEHHQNGVYNRDEVKIKEEPSDSPMETSCSSLDSDSPKSVTGVKSEMESSSSSPSRPAAREEMIIYNMTLLGVVIRQTVSFTKAIPAFRKLSYEDQAVLIKHAILEILMLRCAENYNPEKNTVVDDITGSEWSYSSMLMSGFSSATEPTLKFIQGLNQMTLTRQEFALLQAITIISPDRPDIMDREAVERIQKPMVETLQSLTKINHPDDKVFFAKLIMTLTNVRDLVTHHIDDLMKMKLPDAKFETLFPLITEIFNL